MTVQKTYDVFYFSTRICSLFFVFILLVKLFPAKWELPVIKWFQGRTTVGQKIVLDAFASSTSAMAGGFSEQEALSIRQVDFNQGYSKAIAVLGTADHRKNNSSVSYLAGLALLAAQGNVPGQRQAALKAFFRYYPDFIDDPSLLARVVSFMGGHESVVDDYQAEADFKQALWRVSTRAVDRIRASGSTDFSEISVLTDFYPDLARLITQDIPAAVDLEVEAPENASDGETEPTNDPI